MINYMAWIVIILLALGSIITLVWVWWTKQRLLNLQAAEDHYQRLAEIVGKIEGNPSASDETKEFIAYIAEIIFDQKWVDKIESMVAGAPRTSEKKIVENLKNVVKELRIDNQRVFRQIALANVEVNVIAMLTSTVPFLGCMIRKHPHALDRAIDRFDDTIAKVSSEVNWPLDHHTSLRSEFKKTTSSAKKNERKDDHLFSYGGRGTSRLKNRFVPGQIVPVNPRRHSAMAA